MNQQKKAHQTWYDLLTIAHKLHFSLSKQWRVTLEEQSTQLSLLASSDPVVVAS
jgi:hypothetical protein